MASTNVNADAYDETLGDDADSGTGTELIAREIQDTSTSSQGHVYLSVESAIGEGSTITAATIYWNNVSYSKTGSKPATSDHGEISIYTPPSWVSIYEWTTYDGDGVHSHAFAAGELQYIMGGVYTDRGVGHDTNIMFSVDNPGAGRSSDWRVEAYDAAGTNHVYLAVTYTEAGGGTPRTVIISC